MQPSARQLIEGIDWSLQNKVAPVTEDKWAASTLRSAHCLLQHLAVRVEQEGSLLHDDNADARAVLGEVDKTLSARASYHDIAAAVTAEIERVWREAGEYPTVASLAAENESLRGTVDLLLRALHPLQRADPQGPEAQAAAALDGYIRRRLEREQPLFVPAFLSSTF